MSTPRTLEVARRSLETLSALTAAPAPAELLQQLVRANVLASLDPLPAVAPFRQEPAMVSALAAALEQTDVALSRDVLGGILGITDAVRLDLFERILSYQQSRVPRGDAHPEFHVPFHPSESEIGQALHAEPSHVVSQHLRLAAGYFSLVHGLRRDLCTEANKIGVRLTREAEPPFDVAMQQRLLLYTLEHYPQIVGDPDVRRFIPVAFPAIPSFPTRHIDADEFEDLSHALFSLLLCKQEDSPLLTRTSAEVKKPIGPMITKQAQGMEAFFASMEQAGDNGVVVLDTRQAHRFNPFAYLPALLSNPARRDDPAVAMLRKWPIIAFQPVDPTQLPANVFQQWFDGSRPAGHPCREFSVTPGMLNQSVGLLLRRAVGDAPESFSTQAFMASLISADMDGIHTPEQFRQSVLAARGAITIPDVLEFYFQNVQRLDYPRLMRVLQILSHHGVRTLPSASRNLLVERFHVEPALLDAYDGIAERYAPRLYTPLPDDVHLHSSVQAACAPTIDIIGMHPEADQLAAHLAANDIVTLVDGTHYADAEDADYCDRPGEKAVAAFAYRLMQGEYPALEGYSVVSLEKDDELMSLLLALFHQIDSDDDDDEDMPADTRGDMARMESKLMQLKRFNDRIVLVVDQVDGGHSANDLLILVKHLQRFGIKVVLQSPVVIAGLPQVYIQPFTGQDLSNRLTSAAALSGSLLDVHMPPDVLTHVAERVQVLRGDPVSDPLDLSVETLQLAAAAAKVHCPPTADAALPTVTRAHVAVALSTVFATVDPQRSLLLIKRIDELEPELKGRIFGQDVMLDGLLGIFRDHLLGLKPPHRPSAALITGPTGVGKTEALKVIAKFFGIPFMELQGGDFVEQHHVDMLTGAPPGYVGQGAGKLTNFMKQHEIAIVFIDEIEKAHHSLRTLLMNTFWDGKLSEKTGATFSRPGYIYVAASNAGADSITADMPLRQVQDALARAFARREGPSMPEFIARFQLVHAGAIARQPFLQSIRAGLMEVANYPALQNFEVQVRSIDPTAVQLVFDTIAPLCAYQSRGVRIGFGVPSDAGRLDGELYFNLRQIAYAAQHLTGASASALVRTLNGEGPQSVWPAGGTHLVDVVAEGGKIVLRPA